MASQTVRLYEQHVQRVHTVPVETRLMHQEIFPPSLTTAVENCLGFTAQPDSHGRGIGAPAASNIFSFPADCPFPPFRLLLVFCWAYVVVAFKRRVTLQGQELARADR